MRLLSALGAVLLVGCAQAKASAPPTTPFREPAATAPRGTVVERFRNNEGYTQSELEALSPPEREALAVAAEALLAGDSPIVVTRVEVGLIHAWSPGAEAIFARLTAHPDLLVRLRALHALQEHGLSKMALARDALPAKPTTAVLDSVVRAMGRAADADARAIAALCRSAKHDDELQWRCQIEQARAGAPAALGRHMAAFAQTAPFHLVEERLELLVTELKDRGPWRELADQIDNARRPPDPFEGGLGEYAFCGTRELDEPDSRRTLGDSFAHAIAAATSLQLSFVPRSGKTLSRAERAEVKRKLLASR